MAAFVIAGPSLIGVPGTAGFIGKWYLVLASLEFGTVGILLIAPVLLSSLAAVLYVWKVVEAAYFAELAGMLSVLWLVVLPNIWFGLQPMLPLGLAGDAAKLLLGVAG